MRKHPRAKSDQRKRPKEVFIGNRSTRHDPKGVFHTTPLAAQESAHNPTTANIKSFQLKFLIMTLTAPAVQYAQFGAEPQAHQNPN
jgi:hypothetical protein